MKLFLVGWSGVLGCHRRSMMTRSVHGILRCALTTFQLLIGKINVMAVGIRGWLLEKFLMSSLHKFVFISCSLLFTVLRLC